MTVAGQIEVGDFFQKLGKVQYELQWFMFSFGQLGVLSQAGPTQARDLVTAIRGDVDDFSAAVASLKDQMSILLDNVEENINKAEEIDETV